ncbi:MAG: hypothetical protein A2Y38_13970 [Spirochaetes bacterium GWB1_59_5]|nr:MAG: hypothetical protein A2Y38_13970 [Spirochaetes bacterium GWB1_59_5]
MRNTQNAPSDTTVFILVLLMIIVVMVCPFLIVHVLGVGQPTYRLAALWLISPFVRSTQVTNTKILMSCNRFCVACHPVGV